MENALKEKLLDTGNIIFDGESYLPVFTSDIAFAKQEILIVSPFLAKSRTASMLTALEGAMTSGVSVTAVTQPVGEHKADAQARVAQIIATLRNKGVTVIERADIHQKFAVIDRRTAWYGSINLLGFSKVEESIMRFESKGIAGELMKIIPVA